MNGFRTDWEAQQYAADHGQIATIAQGLHDMGTYISLHGLEDAALIGQLRPPGEPEAYLLPVIHGTDAERRTKVDEWAAIRGERAFWHEVTGTYRAEKHFGPNKIVVYMMPSGEHADQDERELAAVAA